MEEPHTTTHSIDLYIKQKSISIFHFFELFIVDYMYKILGYIGIFLCIRYVYSNWTPFVVEISADFRAVLLR